jgi:site-specific DNA-methyltransferase (adenine-specific)
METNVILQGDCLSRLKELPDESINCIITSPPYYGLRDYGVEGQIGLELTLEDYLSKMLEITKELKRVLKKDGSMYWNHGDCYGGSGTGQKPQHKGKLTSGQFDSMTTQKIFDMRNNSTLPDKCLSFQNFRLVNKMMDSQGWILRNVIIWHKPNAMPSSAKDRFNVDFEPVFFFVKSKKYYFEQQFEPLKESTFNRCKYPYDHNKADKTTMAGLSKYGYRPEEHKGRTMRTTWKITTKSFKEAHFAVYPEKLVETPIKASCPEQGIVLDPFMGGGQRLW